MSLAIPYSQACERNKDPILNVLSPYFERLESVLEIGSGTAQHAIYFAKEHPQLLWQTSDQEQYLDGIKAQLENNPRDNLLSPLQLDVCQPQWVDAKQTYDAIFTANSLHIMAWHQVQALFAGLAAVSKQTAYLFIYGPFNYANAFTSDSNSEFDKILRARGVGSAIRDFEAVNRLAEAQGFTLLADHSMPANNRCLVWKKP